MYIQAKVNYVTFYWISMNVWLNTCCKHGIFSGSLYFEYIFHRMKSLEVSDGSDSESDTDMKHQDSTKIYIQPLVDPNGDISDVDSADEEEWNIDNVSVNRLLASAVLETKPIGKVGIISV